MTQLYNNVMFEGIGAGTGHVLGDRDRDGEHSEHYGERQAPRHQGYLEQAASHQPADEELAEVSECEATETRGEHVSTRVPE